MSTTHTPDFGEPLLFSDNEPTIQDRDGNSVLTGVSYIINGDKIKRSVICTNALAGISDPVTALQKAREALAKAQDELNSLKSYYGKNLQVFGWHLNGEPEPYDNFIKDNDCGATESVIEALALLTPNK